MLLYKNDNFALTLFFFFFNKAALIVLKVSRSNLEFLIFGVLFQDLSSCRSV